MFKRYLFKNHIYIFHNNIIERENLFKIMAEKAYKHGYIRSEQALIETINEKEKDHIIEIKPHIVLPHARGDFVKQLFLMIGISDKGIIYKGAKKNRAKVVILVGVPTGNTEYLQLLASISRYFSINEFVDGFTNSQVSEDAIFAVNKYSYEIQKSTDEEPPKKYLIILSLNDNYIDNKIGSILFEVGIELPIEIDAKNLGSANMFIPFLSTFGLTKGINKYNKTFIGITNDKEAAVRLNGLLKSEKIDLTLNGVGFLCQIELMNSYGGIAEDIEF